jgi:hypothetical protein
MDVKIKAMTLAEYEKYLAYLNECYEKVNDKKMQTFEMGMLVMKWVAKEIYGIDPYTLHPGTLKYIADKTVEMTEKSEIEDEKNSVKSGSGE